jgi:hypothetical protein
VCIGTAQSLGPDVILLNPGHAFVG